MFRSCETRDQHQLGQFQKNKVHHGLKDQLLPSEDLWDFIEIMISYEPVSVSDLRVRPMSAGTLISIRITKSIQAQLKLLFLGGCATCEAIQNCF